MTAEQEKMLRQVARDLDNTKNVLETLIYRMGELSEEERNKLKKIHKALCATIDET